MRLRLTTMMIGCALAVLAGCSSSPSKAAKTTAPPVSFTNYVSLGDSYTSGPFIEPTAPGSPPQCLRSGSNYPSYLASYLKVKNLTDVSCGGAITADLYSSQSKRVGIPQSAETKTPPQIDAVTSKTDLVTIGIGGNDFDVFHGLLLTSRGIQDVEARLAQAREIQPSIEKAIEDIRKRAPHAKIVVVGYLRVFASDGSCRGLPAAHNRAQADRIERRINTSLAQAAKRQQVTFIDSYDLGNGHDVCAGTKAWVNGSRNALSIAAAFHPFRQGMDAVAREIYRALKGKKPAHSPSLEQLEAVPR